MIPQSFIHDLLNRVDIVDTIDRHVPLKKAGANFVACCPFHNEKTPSFTVSQTKQFYHCFGCGAHGNAINFIIEYNGLGFVEAVQSLAGYAGMEVPLQSNDNSPKHIVSNDLSQDPGNNQDHESDVIVSKDLINAMQIATHYYREQLKLSEKAIFYLKKRGISGKTAARFAIGYAPAAWQNLEAVFSDYSSERIRRILMQAGLVIINDDAKQYDRFRDRIMFPILNQKGQIVGFGGRVLAQEEPKYLNSPETTLFEKGRELYNFFSARRAIREANCVIVVEGYMDVIALSQHGVDNVVATLGTATTSFHVQRLLRQTDNIIFCFDGDRAGRKAAWRALENSLELLTDGKYLGFLFLPEGADPDSYVNQYGKESFEKQIAQAMPLSEFFFKELCTGIKLQTGEGRAKLVKDAKPLLQRIVAPALSLILKRRLAELSELADKELDALLQIKRVSEVKKVGNNERKRMVTLYRRLIRILLYDPSYVTKLDRDLFVKLHEKNEETAALEALFVFFDAHPHLIEKSSVFSIASYFQDSPYKTLLESIECETMEWNHSTAIESEFSDTLKKLRLMQYKERITELQSKSLNMLSDEEKMELQQLVKQQ
ncbi:DNA primase [Nitrosomonas sp.]|uniref:DNA primase n=1 Tax=Nitrosomonas sp. TaxID=42353 RepID=UPI001D60AB97|nr:DNA primase [Nitrosomonas sp.]MBX3616613.1 DNA primase [Nitrosomonas sp.]